MVILVDGLEFLVLTLPEETIISIQLDQHGTRARMHDGISFYRSPSDDAGCYPVLFSSKGISYQKCVEWLEVSYMKVQIDRCKK